jgi:hypothetical protein
MIKVKKYSQILIKYFKKRNNQIKIIKIKISNQKLETD